MPNKTLLLFCLGCVVIAGVTVAAYFDVIRYKTMADSLPVLRISDQKAGREDVRRNDRTDAAAQQTAEQTFPPATSASPATGLANPASENCTAKGGTLIIQRRGDGGEYGLCTFEDAYACEEWALFRGDCPVGGVRTTGYDTVAQKYCAWVGGQTLAEPNATCTFPDGSTCKDNDLFNGHCRPGDNPAQ